MLLVMPMAVDRPAQAISLKTNASDCILPRHEIRLSALVSETPRWDELRKLGVIVVEPEFHSLISLGTWTCQLKK